MNLSCFFRQYFVSDSEKKQGKFEVNQRRKEEEEKTGKRQGKKTGKNRKKQGKRREKEKNDGKWKLDLHIPFFWRNFARFFAKT